MSYCPKCAKKLEFDNRTQTLEYLVWVCGCCGEKNCRHIETCLHEHPNKDRKLITLYVRSFPIELRPLPSTLVTAALEIVDVLSALRTKEQKAIVISYYMARVSAVQLDLLIDHYSAQFLENLPEEYKSQVRELVESILPQTPVGTNPTVVPPIIPTAYVKDYENTIAAVVNQGHRFLQERGFISDKDLPVSLGPGGNRPTTYEDE